MLNQGPMKKCPKCEKMMPTIYRFVVDVVICYAMLPRGFCTLVHSLFLVISKKYLNAIHIMTDFLYTSIMPHYIC